jgi:hypothetical protein
MGPPGPPLKSGRLMYGDGQNFNWLVVKQSDKLEYRCNEWFENTAVITANNKTIKDHIKLKRHQWGGHIISGKRQVST